jgi:DnaK suppressor protein
MDLATQTHLKTLRDLLTYRLAELRADVRADASACRDDVALAAGGEVSDQKDGAGTLQRAEVDDAQLQRDLDELESVERALARLEAGTYGDCATCGDAIALERLRVQPAAEHCAHCQGEREKHAAH